ncbi:MAG: HD domain-containing protein [Acidimicrobiales bacterium]|nr:HD domain-containing protein [Acidimicrobiales bacterium]RZV44651.1 MAG: HD domain-containing protein [Acidimicrobiales bacterium]
MNRVDGLISELAAMASHSYGERVNMLEHSLQTAAVARAEGAEDELVLAALFHDIGHVKGDAGVWGLATHAEVGATYLSELFPVEVTEPIRLHVDAKRHLVATDPSYAEALSEASSMSLAEQGGPFTAEESASFLRLDGAEAAITLRRWDDHGKIAGADVKDLEFYRPLIAESLLSATNATWAREACRTTWRTPRWDCRSTRTTPTAILVRPCSCCIALRLRPPVGPANSPTDFTQRSDFETRIPSPSRCSPQLLSRFGFTTTTWTYAPAGR